MTTPRYQHTFSCDDVEEELTINCQKRGHKIKEIYLLGLYQLCPDAPEWVKDKAKKVLGLV